MGIARQALEPKVGVEALRVLVGRVDDKRPRRNDARRRGRAANGVLQQSGSCRLSLIALVDSELAKQRSGNRVRGVSAQRPSNRPDPRDRMGAQGIKAANLTRSEGQDVHPCRPVAHRTMCALLEPGVIVTVAREEPAHIFLVEKRADATKR